MPHPRGFWTPARDAVLRERYPSDPKGAAAALGVTLTAARTRAARIGVSTGRAFWNPDHDATLRELYTTHTAEQLARTFARSVKAVQQRATALGLRKFGDRDGLLPRVRELHGRGLTDTAIVRELGAMRTEADAVRAAPVHRPGDFGAACPWCGGTNGAVSVPMRANWWQGRVVAAKHFGACSYPTPRVLTCGVLCDRPGCAEGARACAAEQRLDPARRRPTLTGFARRLGLSAEQVLAAVREHDRAEGLRAGRALGAAAGAFDEVVRRIRAKVAAHETSGESDRYAA
jgi:hypothetical protein